jgi:hypothetical protein
VRELQRKRSQLKEISRKMSEEEGMTLKEVFEFFVILIILAVVSAIGIIMIIIGQILDFFRGKEEK